MHLQFLADHCVPTLVIENLHAAGHEVTRLRDWLPPESPDENVIAKAQELAAILLTLNGDFADITAYPPANYRGIVALQVRNRYEILPQIVARLQTYLAAHPDMAHYQGKLLLVEVHRIRIRR